MANHYKEITEPKPKSSEALDWSAFEGRGRLSKESVGSEPNVKIDNTASTSNGDRSNNDPIAKGHELVDFMEGKFNNISKDKKGLTREDLKAFKTKNSFSDREQQYLSFVEERFNEIANLVPDSNEPNPYSEYDLRNPRIANEMSLADIRALNILDQKSLNDVIDQNQKHAVYEGVKFCNTAINDAALTGLGAGVVVGGVAAAWSGPGVVGGMFGGGLLGWAGGGLVGGAVCVVGGPVRTYNQYTHNRQVENWFTEKQDTVRTILDKPTF